MYMYMCPSPAAAGGGWSPSAAAPQAWPNIVI